MFSKPSDKKSGLETAIDNLLFEMKGERPDSEEYAAMVSQLNVLYKLKEVDSKKRVSPDTMLIAATNLVGIALILFHERANVATSKALNFIMKLR